MFLLLCQRLGQPRVKRSSGRWDVVIDTKEVVGVVGPLDRLQPLVVGLLIRPLHAVRIGVGPQEIGKRSPRVPLGHTPEQIPLDGVDPLDLAGHGDHPRHEAERGVPIADRAR